MNPAQINARLHNSILEVCPIDGVAILDGAAHKIRVDYREDATPEQRSAAQSVIAAFDWSDEAQELFDIQIKACALAVDPILQYALGQIKKACPNYVIPDKKAIATDQIIADAAKEK